MSQTATIQIKIDPIRKQQAIKMFNSMGLSLTDAIKLFIQQSINTNSLPFQPTAKEYVSLDNPLHPYYAKLTPQEEIAVTEGLKDVKNSESTILKNSTDIDNYFDNLS